MRRMLALFVGVILSIGCTDLGNPYVAPPPDIPLVVLRAAPDTLVVNGRRLSLSAYLWRDFMPISPPDGKPLMAVLTISAADSATIPSSLVCDAVWVIYQHEIWKAWLEIPPPGGVKPNQISRTARDGPRWGPNVYVDVIVRVIDASGASRLLRAPHQWIGRTD